MIRCFGGGEEASKTLIVERLCGLQRGLMAGDGCLRFEARHVTLAISREPRFSREELPHLSNCSAGMERAS